MQNIIALILANLPTLLEAGKAGFDFIQTVRTSARQTGEWTEADEADFQAKLAEQSIDPAWLPDFPLTCPKCGKVNHQNDPGNCRC